MTKIGWLAVYIAASSIVVFMLYLGFTSTPEPIPTHTITIEVEDIPSHEDDYSWR